MKKENEKVEFETATKKRLTRVFIAGLLCIAYSIYLVIDGIILDASIFQYSLAVLTFIAGLFFVISKFKFEKKLLGKKK